VKEDLSDLEAYKAMCYFLENYYNQTNSDDIGSLLGSMQILEDRNTADPTMWNDWKDCIKKSTS